MYSCRNSINISLSETDDTHTHTYTEKSSSPNEKKVRGKRGVRIIIASADRRHGPWTQQNQKSIDVVVVDDDDAHRPPERYRTTSAAHPGQKIHGPLNRIVSPSNKREKLAAAAIAALAAVDVVSRAQYNKNRKAEQNENVFQQRISALQAEYGTNASQSERKVFAIQNNGIIYYRKYIRICATM